jgi:hypothetical protein
LRLAPDVNVRVATETVGGFGNRRRPKNRTQSASFPHAMLRAHRPLQF